MKTTIVSVFLLVAATSSNHFGVSGSQLERSKITCEDRQSTGLICTNDCRTISYCVENNGVWNTTTIRNCPMFTACNQRTGKCDIAYGHCRVSPSGSMFICTGVGIFPDPFNCQRYHLCTSENEWSNVFDCVGKYSFNVKQNACTNPLNVPSCQVDSFSCPEIGSSGAWPGNNNIYYVCTNEGNGIFPKMYRCPGNQIFVDGQCEDSARLLSKATVECNGASGNIPDPDNCFKYYWCGVSQEPVPQRCPNGFYFNSLCLSCRRGACPY